MTQENRQKVEPTARRDLVRYCVPEVQITPTNHSMQNIIKITTTISKKVIFRNQLFFNETK